MTKQANKDWDRTEENIARHARSWSNRSLTSIVVWLLVIVFIGSAVAGTLGFMANFMANPFRQAARVVNKTIDADNMIANYEWFKQRVEDIDATRGKAKLAKAAVGQFKEDAGPRSDWHFQDREEHSRLSSVELGLNQQLEDLIAEYNAKSRMANRSIFKAGDVELPERIE